MRGWCDIQDFAIYSNIRCLFSECFEMILRSKSRDEHVHPWEGINGEKTKNNCKKGTLQIQGIYLELVLKKKINPFIKFLQSLLVVKSITGTWKLFLWEYWTFSKFFHLVFVILSRPICTTFSISYSCLGSYISLILKLRCICMLIFRKTVWIFSCGCGNFHVCTFGIFHVLKALLTFSFGWSHLPNNLISMMSWGGERGTPLKVCTRRKFQHFHNLAYFK